MKYWNKRERARKHWTMIHKEHNNIIDVKNMKIECQRYNSPGKFYFELNFSEDTGYRHSIWWFEFVEDATYFKLKWK